MCFSSLSPDPPKLPPMPTVPSVRMEEVRAREQREYAQAALAGQGTPSTVKTDLVPGSVQQQQAPQRRVLLGA